MYEYGDPFNLYIGHRPLELIYSNPMSKPPERIERWLLRLQQYNFKVVYKKGTDNPADYLSRHVTEEKAATENIAEDYVDFVSQAALPKAMKIEEIQRGTQNDDILRALRAAIRTGKRSSDRLRPYKQIPEELSYYIQ